METIMMESPMIEDLKEERYILNLLKYVFWSEPTEEFLRDLLKVSMPSEEDELDGGLTLMIESVKRHRDDLAAYAEDLAVEFARLFIGPKYPPAIPYASFYLSESKTVMTNTTIEVRKRYLDAGMAVKDLYSTPDDHIGIELEFVSYLTERTIELFEDRQRAEASRLFEIKNDFVNEHMSLWVPAFVDRLMEHTKGDFYKGAALVLNVMIKK